MKQKTILKSASLVSLITIISLIISFIKEAIFAYWFGTSIEADAFNVATQLPITLFSVISCAIGTTLIPSYTKLLFRVGKERAEQYFQRFSTLILSITAFLVLLGELFAAEVVGLFAPGLQVETKAIAVYLFRISLPTILMSELTEISTGILHAHNSFALPASLAIISNTVFITTICLVSNYFGIISAIGGLCLGMALSCYICSRARKKYIFFKFQFTSNDPEVLDSVKKSVPVFIGIGVDGVNKIVDKMIASYMASGTITMLSYASKLSGAIASLITNALSTVLFPEFSKNVANNDREKLSELYISSLRFVLILLIPIVFGLFFVAKEVVSVVFYRGRITLEDINSITPLFIAYGVSLIFLSIRQINTRMLYANGNTRVAMINSSIGFIANIFLNFLFSRLWGALGLAIATAVTNAIISELLFRWVINNYLDIKLKQYYTLIANCMISGIVMSIVLLLFQKVTFMTGVASNNLLLNCLKILINIVIGAPVYFAALKFQKVQEVRELFSMIKGVLSKLCKRKK